MLKFVRQKQGRERARESYKMHLLVSIPSFFSALGEHSRFLSYVAVAECITHSRCWPTAEDTGDCVIWCFTLLGRNPITENKLSPQTLSNKLKLNITGLQAVYHPHSHARTLGGLCIGGAGRAHRRSHRSSTGPPEVHRETGISNLESQRVTKRERVKDKK